MNQMIPIPAPDDPAFSVNSWVPREVVLRDAWFPVAHGHAVGRRPIRRQVHSQPYYLWRDASGAVASEFHPADSPGEPGFFTGGTGRYPVIER